MSARNSVAVIGVLVATLLSSSAALAFDRTSTLTTRHGTYTKAVEASCTGGRCSRDAEITGPNGRTASRSSTCSATRRFYGCSGTVTGPNGNSATRGILGRRRF